MTGTVDRELFGSTAARGSVVLAVATVQLSAFVAAYALGRPTLYALFAVGSVGVLAAATGGGTRGALVAAAGTGLLGATWWVLGQPWFGSLPVVGALATPPRGVGVFLLGPPVLSALVALSGDRWEGVAAATLGCVLVVALGLPLALFVAGQDPALVEAAALNPAVQRMLALSMLAPLAAATFSVAFGVPLAYLLARGFPGQSVVESLVALPLVIPHSVAGIVVLFGFGEGGAFPELRILNGLAGMVLAMAFVSAPYAVNAARQAFAGVDRSLVWAARGHGAPPVEAFRRVTLPLAWRGILTGGVLAWARAVSEFGAVAVVAYTVSVTVPGGQFTTRHAPVYIYNAYVTRGLPEASAVATILLAISAAVFLVIRWLTDERGGVLA